MFGFGNLRLLDPYDPYTELIYKSLKQSEYLAMVSGEKKTRQLSMSQLHDINSSVGLHVGYIKRNNVADVRINKDMPWPSDGLVSLLLSKP